MKRPWFQFLTAFKIISFKLLKWIIKIFLHVSLRKLEASCCIMDTWARYGMYHFKDLHGKRKKKPTVNILWVILQWCRVLLQFTNVTLLLTCAMVSKFYWVSAFLLSISFYRKETYWCHLYSQKVGAAAEVFLWAPG